MEHHSAVSVLFYAELFICQVLPFFPGKAEVILRVCKHEFSPRILNTLASAGGFPSGADYKEGLSCLILMGQLAMGFWSPHSLTLN